MEKNSEDNQAGIDYSAIAHGYDRFRSNSPAYLRRIIDIGEINSTSTVLDLGCGTGTAARFIASETAAHLVGADAAIGMLQRAQIKQPDFDLVNADARWLPFEDRIFDTVYSVYMLHHIDDLERVLGECYRVLKKGRLIVVTSSHAQIEAYHPALRECFPSYVEIDKGRFPDIPVIEGAMTRVGFTDLCRESSISSRVHINHNLIKKIGHKYVSTYWLISDEEFSSGIEKLKQFVKQHGPSHYQDWNCTILSGAK